MFNFLGDGNLARIDVYALDGKVQWVWLAFTGLLSERRDLDRVAYFVRELVQEIKGKYDRHMVKKSVFYWDYPWAGYMLLEDEEGDSLTLSWREYSVDIKYCTKDFMAYISEMQTTGECKDAGAL